MSEEERHELLRYYRKQELFWYRATCAVPEPALGEVARDILRNVFQKWEHYDALIKELDT